MAVVCNKYTTLVDFISSSVLQGHKFLVYEIQGKTVQI